MKSLFILALSGFISWITGPLFFGVCGAKDDPAKCIMVRGGIFIVTFIVLSLLTSSSKS